MDLLEEGRSSWSPSVTDRKKSKTRAWNRGHVLKEKSHELQRTQFTFYQEDSHDLLLTAILIKKSGTFYMFPDTDEYLLTEPETILAEKAMYALFWDRNNRFQLQSKNTCQYCDSILGKFTCCTSKNSCETDMNQNQNQNYRETLGYITHEMKPVPGAPGIKARHVSVSLPAYRKEYAMFDPWCPRTKNMINISDDNTKIKLDNVIATLKKQEEQEEQDEQDEQDEQQQHHQHHQHHQHQQHQSRSTLEHDTDDVYARSLRDWIDTSNGNDRNRKNNRNKKNRSSSHDNGNSSSTSSSSSSGLSGDDTLDDTLSDTASDSEQSVKSNHSNADSNEVCHHPGNRTRLPSIEQMNRKSWEDENLKRRRSSLEKTRALMNPLKPQLLITNMPRWDASVESLVLQFQRNRVHMSSSKNILILEETLHTKKQSAKKSACLQFGKSSSGKFNLDWRGSISLVQAFAIGISTFAWSTKNR